MNGTRVVFSPFFSPPLSSSPFCSSRQQHLVDVGCARVHTLVHATTVHVSLCASYCGYYIAINGTSQCNLQTRTFPLRPLRSYRYSSPSFSFLSLSLFLVVSFAFPRCLIFNPVISYRERGNRVSSIKRLSLDIWYFEMKGEILKFDRYDEYMLNCRKMFYIYFAIFNPRINSANGYLP